MNLRLIVIDSLSSLFSGLAPKNQSSIAQQKELLHLFKILTKKYFIGIVYTNNTKDAHITRVSELRNLVGEPISSFCCAILDWFLGARPEKSEDSESMTIKRRFILSFLAFRRLTR